MKRSSLDKIKGNFKPIFRNKNSYPKDYFKNINSNVQNQQKKRYCSNCGEELIGELKFCFFCGEASIPRKITLDKSDKCPECGAKINPEMPICQKCDKHILGDISEPY